MFNILDFQQHLSVFFYKFALTLVHFFEIQPAQEGGTHFLINNIYIIVSSYKKLSPLKPMCNFNGLDGFGILPAL